ncbi:hypothetical protein AB0H03_04305 [Streptomyces sparsogenes]|uniref:hypothetical protein n=1 Tax=Streptomyces sparsogenes TaxID=67365 RepID=UPI0033F10030
MISHITIDKKDATYDHRAGQAALSVTVHHRDGRTEQSRLVMDPGQVELFTIQLGQLIETRAHARRRNGELAGM